MLNFWILFLKLKSCLWKIIKELDLNDKQAEGILGMPLRKLTNLETQSLYKESDNLQLEKKQLQLLLYIS